MSLKFLPPQFPSKQDILIPAYDEKYVQRVSYPYTYTSTLLIEEADKHTSYHKVGTSGKGIHTAIVPQKANFYVENDSTAFGDVPKAVIENITKKNVSEKSNKSDVLPSLASGSKTIENPQFAKARTQVFTLAGILVQMLDPLSAMYSKEWIQDAEREFRFHIMSFLSDNDVSSVLGKTRCRDCLYYFEKAVVKPSKSRVASLATFLSFWLDAKIIVGDTPYAWKTIAKTSDKVIHLDHLDNGQWIVKNDKI